MKFSGVFQQRFCLPHRSDIPQPKEERRMWCSILNVLYFDLTSQSNGYFKAKIQNIKKTYFFPNDEETFATNGK